jgi:hypothetical protein
MGICNGTTNFMLSIRSPARRGLNSGFHRNGQHNSTCAPTNWRRKRSTSRHTRDKRRTSVYLIEGKTTFTSHEVRALRSSIPTKNIKKYLLGRHNWDDKIFKSIVWEAYASAIRSLDANMHKFIVKLCNNWLPVGQRLIKYGNTYDHCSLCRQHESYDHVFCCQSRNKWRDCFLAHSTKKWLTADDIRQEIVRGLQGTTSMVRQTLR